jgi:hypothetical protein
MVLIKMAVKSRVRLGRRLNPREEQWLVQKVGPRLHYLPGSIGGVGWLAKCEQEPMTNSRTGVVGKALVWYLEFEDDKLASYFALKFL